MPSIINKYIRKLWLYARKKPIYYLSTTHILCNFLAKSVVQRIFWRHADFTMHLTVFEFQFRSDSWNTSGNNETQKWSWDLPSYWRSGWKETKASFTASTGHSDAFWQITYLGCYLVQDCKYVMRLFKVCRSDWTIMYFVFTHDTVLNVLRYYVSTYVD